MKTKYCFWSVCDGAYGAMMEHCLRTARQAGVFKEFHVLTDRPLKGCECYDAFQFEKEHGLFKLHYLKVGMSRLNFDYLVWLDADTIFVSNPVDLLGSIGKSPIHVPLEINLTAMNQDAQWKGVSLFAVRDLMCRQGVMNSVYLSQSSFWIVHHDAIDLVYDLALGFWQKAKEAGVLVDVSPALGYAMQMLCADPESHLLVNDPDLWASDDEPLFQGNPPKGAPWSWRHPLATQAVEIRPAIIHFPKRREFHFTAPEAAADSHSMEGI